VALGVNLVVLSHPGPFTERPPYRLDEQIQANLDRLIDMADPAGLIVVTALRTGLRQSDFTFYRDGAGDGFDPELLIEDVWTSLSTQSGWCEMWQQAAARYRDHPAVVGYELMVEPNGAHVVHEIWDQDDFYPRHAGSLTDWNAFCPRIVVAVRGVDPTTPVLIGSMGWSSVEWLPYLETIDDPRIVYTVHQYEPQPQYTHQEPGGTHRYPGWFDLDWAGRPDRFDRTWLARRLQTVVEFRQSHGVPVAVTEFGLKRWVPDAGTFMTDQMALFEELGLGYAVWAFYPDWSPIVEIDDFDFLHGTDPGNRSDAESDLLGAIRDAWSHNLLRSADE
jgi:endoglucanase